MRGRKFLFGGVEYLFVGMFSYAEKAVCQNDILGIKIGIKVKNIETGEVLNWKELKDGYIAEKISDYILNSFNGQDSFY